MKRTYQFNERIYSYCAIIIALAMTVCLVTEYFIESREVQDECLRLHVIACSDSERDQEVKLKVRDAILESGAEIFDGTLNADEALEKITPYIPYLEKIANQVLIDNGFDYKSKVSVVNEFFETRQYDDITLPAGEYTAFKIVLGEGNGKNWWCVMFPPLCLPAAEDDSDDSVYAVFGKNGMDIVSGKKEYKVRFKIVETIEKIIEKLSK